MTVQKDSSAPAPPKGAIVHPAAAVKKPTVADTIVAYAHTLLGIHEVPDGSNDGPAVHELQKSTGAFKAPWCVSTGQTIAIHAYGHTLFDASANAYYCGSYSDRHGWTVPRPIRGCFVVYHIGSGHFGTCVEVHPDGTFDAIEGNSGNAVRLEHRDPKAIRCQFIAPPGLPRV